jgi:transposase-like protein
LQPLTPILGEAYSAQTVSRITRALDAAVERFHRGRLEDHYVYLFLDGVVLKVRDRAGRVRRGVVLVAYGITRAGHRELIAYRLVAGESEAAWSAFLQDLFLRCLEGRGLQLVITDGSTGLRAALALVYPQPRLQLCWAHKMRNIADKVPKKEGSCVQEAVASIENHLEELLNFFDVPKTHWVKVRTTNMIERAFREVRRRTRPMSSFTNPASCDRIVFGVISHLNRSWERNTLKQFTHNT